MNTIALFDKSLSWPVGKPEAVIQIVGAKPRFNETVFVLLEVDNNPASGLSCKVLTEDGYLGWFYIHKSYVRNDDQHITFWFDEEKEPK